MNHAHDVGGGAGGEDCGSGTAARAGRCNPAEGASVTAAGPGVAWHSASPGEELEKRRKKEENRLNVHFSYYLFPKEVRRRR